MRWWLAGLVGCAPQTEDGPEPEVIPLCNGSDALCDRTIDEVVFVATHNSMSSDERGWLGPNHLYAVPTQLADGVRALNLDVYEVEGQAMLCHGFCSLGEQPLVEALDEVGAWLSANPREVILLTFEMYAPPELVVTAFEDASLVGQAHALQPGQLPTLGELIEADERLLVFTSDGGGSPGWYHAMWDWWWDNPYAAETVEDFSCALYRGDKDNPLMAINHFLTAPIGLERLAQEANTADVLETHIRACMASAGRHPTQIMVDFYSIGDVFEVAAALNR